MAVWSKATLAGVYSSRRIDSEFFQPAYFAAEEKIRRCKTDYLGRLGFFVSGPFGSTFHVKNYDLKSPYRYIRGRDVKPFFLLEDDNRYIPAVDFLRLQDYIVRPDDLMISVVGTLGNVAICTADDTPAIFSCKSTLFRSQGPDPYYLLAYFNCQHARLCLLRRQRGAVQTGLNIEDLRALPVPRFNPGVESQIATGIRVAYKALRDSKACYSQAQQILESELGLDKLNIQRPVGYTTQFSELELSRRADAEFFHTKYDPFLSAATNYENGWAPLKQLTSRILPNFDTKKQEIDFDYVEIGDICVSDGAYTKNRVNTKLLPANAKIRLNGGELIISQVRPTRGAIAIVEDNLSHATVCSGAFYVCTSNNNDYREIIWLYLRSIRNVFEKYCGGTSYPTMDSQYISKFPIPLFNKDLAEKVRDLIIQSKNAKQASESLLEGAKARVEQLIEEAAKS
jgi:hypothetical protein